MADTIPILVGILIFGAIIFALRPYFMDDKDNEDVSIKNSVSGTKLSDNSWNIKNILLPLVIGLVIVISYFYFDELKATIQSTNENILNKLSLPTDLIMIGLVTALIWALWATFFKKKSVQNQSQNQNQNQDQVKTGSNGFAVTILIITATILVAFHFFPEEVKSLFEKDKQSEILKFFLDTWLAIKESLGEDLIKVLVWVTALLITILVWALNRSWVTGLVMGVTFLFTVFMTTFALDKDQTEIQEKSEEVKVDLRRIKPEVPIRIKGGVFDTFVLQLPVPPAHSSYDHNPRMSYRVCGKIVGPEALLNFADFPLFHMEFEEKNLGRIQRMMTTDAVKDYIGKQSTIEAMGGFQVNELELEFETRFEVYGSPFTCRNVRYTL